jgi:hypothetical protein
MRIKEAIESEFKVAFSKKAQPIWFRITKWAAFVGVACLLYRTELFLIWVMGVPIIGVTVHFIYRWKTKGWKRSWRGWDSKTGEWKPKIWGCDRTRTD